MRKNILLSLVFVFISQAAWSEQGFYKGSELLTACQAYVSDTGDKVKAETCAGFVMGVVDMHSMLVTKGVIQAQWCTPQDVTLDQLIQATLDYMMTQPERLDTDAGGMVANALYKDYHCH